MNHIHRIVWSAARGAFVVAHELAHLREREHEVNTLVYDAVARFEGSISAEHGIGGLKVDTLPHYKSAVALDLMARIKLALDPQRTLNPGCVVR